MTFDALKPDGQQAWALTIQPQFMAVNCSDYSRWVEVWARARELMRPFLPLLARERGIHVIGLQYIDQFVVTQGASDLRADHLFRPASPLLPPNVFGLTSLWHSHHGYFEDLAEPAAHRRLNTVDVDVVDTEGRRIIQITTAHRAFLDQPYATADGLLDAPEGHLDRQMVALHAMNKGFLRQLLNDAACEQIGL